MKFLAAFIVAEITLQWVVAVPITLKEFKNRKVAYDQWNNQNGWQERLNWDRNVDNNWDWNRNHDNWDWNSNYNNGGWNNNFNQNTNWNQNGYNGYNPNNGYNAYNYYGGGGIPSNGEFTFG